MPEAETSQRRGERRNVATRAIISRGARAERLFTPRAIPRDYFGPHLMLDGLEADPRKLNDMRRVYQFLDELPEKIGMQKITTPYVIPYAGGEKPEDAGITGVVIIAESHISIHTFPWKGFVTIDVYSCHPFEQKAAVAFARELFGIGRCEVRSIERGHGFRKT